MELSSAKFDPISPDRSAARWLFRPDGQPRRIKPVHARGVAAGDLGLLVIGYPGEDLRQDLPRSGKCRLAVRIVRAPHHVVDADDVAQANPDRVLLKA